MITERIDFEAYARMDDDTLAANLIAASMDDSKNGQRELFLLMTWLIFNRSKTKTAG